MTVKLFILLVITVGWSEGKGKEVNCKETVAFSSIGIKQIYTTDLVRFSEDVFDSKHGWTRDTGTFTIACSGTYLVSFTIHGNSDTRFTLKTRSTSNIWTPIVSTVLGGGSHTIVLGLSTGEQIAIYASGSGIGNIERSHKTSSFSAHLLHH